MVSGSMWIPFHPLHDASCQGQRLDTVPGHDDEDLVGPHGLQVLAQDGVQLIVVGVDDSAIFPQLRFADVSEFIRAVVAHERMPHHVQPEKVDPVDLWIVHRSKHSTDTLIGRVVGERTSLQVLLPIEVVVGDRLRVVDESCDLRLVDLGR